MISTIHTLNYSTLLYFIVSSKNLSRYYQTYWIPMNFSQNEVLIGAL